MMTGKVSMESMMFMESAQGLKLLPESILLPHQLRIDITQIVQIPRRGLPRVKDRCLAKRRRHMDRSKLKSHTHDRNPQFMAKLQLLMLD